MPEAPEEVKDSIEATNFFFSLFLIMIGVITLMDIVVDKYWKSLKDKGILKK